MALVAKALLVTTLVAVAVFWWLSIPVRYRYRLHVEVQTPSGVRQGDAVHEISVRREPIKLADGYTATVKLRGEAVAIDVGDGKLLFVLTRPENGEETIIPAVQSALDPDYRRGGAANFATASKLAKVSATQPVRLAETNSFEGGTRPFLPLFVTFADANDRSTIRKVDPRRLDAEFGPGVELKDITVAVTRSPVTERITDELPWLKSQPLTMDPRWRGSAHPTFAQMTSFREFRRGFDG